MTSKRHLFIIMLLCLYGLCKADVVITPGTERMLAGQDLFILKPDRELDILEAMNSDEFVKSDLEVPNPGLSKYSVWLRFTVANQSPRERWLLNLAYPRFKETALYTETDGRILKQEIRTSAGFAGREYKSHNLLFDLAITPGSSKTYYLRLNSSEQLFIPLYITRVRSEIAYSSQDNMLSGIFMGVVLIMIFYNLFVYFSVRDKSYIYYVIYVFFAGLTQFGLKGFNFQYLWPSASSFELISVTLFGTLAGIAALLFIRNFLELKRQYPGFNIAVHVFIILFLAGLLLLLSGRWSDSFRIMQLVTSVSSFGVFVMALILILKGHRTARFFFIAWSVLLTGAIIFILKDYGILPYNTFTSYSVQLASAIEMALLSFGLADRINILKKEKELSQAEALRISQENERIIREQNMMLELKVDERTLELKEANNELNVTLENLKQAQSQLVESEKMASLGQLTAGIAHEINNPINFVTSNVTPLKRDVDMLLDAMSSIENVALTDSPIPEKQKYIEQLKEELDLDYLKVEIGYLLKGIHEGATRTAEIVKGLRIFSRVDENDLKKADINEGLESTLVIINNLLNNKISVVKEFGNIPLIECYPGKLNQVFLNIMTNAIHAIKEKFGDAQGGGLRLSTWHNDASVFVKITDNGTGMDENTQKKIFEPFFTTKEVGEGTGLGMSIAYNTMIKHNGRIHFDSEKGEGTTFILELPVLHKL